MHPGDLVHTGDLARAGGLGHVVDLALWSILAVVLVGLEATARATRHLPTAGAALGALTRFPVLRIVLLLGWMWLGWHLFAR